MFIRKLHLHNVPLWCLRVHLPSGVDEGSRKPSPQPQGAVPIPPIVAPHPPDRKPGLLGPAGASERSRGTFRDQGAGGLTMHDKPPVSGPGPRPRPHPEDHHPQCPLSIPPPPLPTPSILPGSKAP